MLKVDRYYYNERQSGRFSGKLVREDGVTPIASSELATLTLTVIDEKSGDRINSRDAQNVLNANGVTVDSAGNLVWTILPADNQILNPLLAFEVHKIFFRWTWSNGLLTLEGNLLFEIEVKNLQAIS